MNQLTKQKIRALELTREMLMHRDCPSAYTGICRMLNIVALTNPNLQLAVRQLGSYIDKALEGFGWLQDWHRYKLRMHIKPTTHSTAFKLKMRTTRVAWIDWMIASLEGKV